MPANKEAKACFKSSSPFLICGGDMPENCLLFCASSKVTCAKLWMSMLGTFTEYASMFTGGASKVAKTAIKTPEKIPKIKSMLEKFGASLLISKTTYLINNFDQFEKNEPEMQWFHYFISNFRDLIGLELVKSSIFFVFF